MNLNPINKERIGRARVFFRSKKWKNTLVFLSFVVLASGFWALQFFHQKFEFEVPIRVNYIHIPAGIALSGKLPQEIMIHVQDKGSVYLRYLYKHKKQFLFITVDLETISLSKASYIVDQTVLRNLINDILFASTQIISFSPDKIEINYSQLAQKELPVVINGAISPATGYMFLETIMIEPAKVVAYGSINTLDTLREIKTQALNYTDIDNNLTVTADLELPDGVNLLIDHVTLSAMVEEYTEKTFELPIICYNLPPTRRIHFFPSTVELSVRVGLSKYSQLSESFFEISVNYNDLIKRNTSNCSLTLTRKPYWLESYRITPEVIEFLIELKK